MDPLDPTQSSIQPPRILIAGIGNIFFGDDAFGVEVVRRLLSRPPSAWPAGVRVVDFGIRSLDLTYALSDGCEVAILLDAVSRGGTPGTLYLLEPVVRLPDGAPAPAFLDAHSMHVDQVLRSAAAMGGTPGKIYLVGCEPSPDGMPEGMPGGEGADEMWAGLSAPVRAAVDEAVAMVESLVEQILRPPRPAPAPQDN